uniref:Uncharacterized protein n=1 Tax=Lepeophtheirus salmonis TaxID=72036 RepID=A0A0K2T1D5_LEPSM
MIEKFEGAATCWDIPSSGRPRTAGSVENIVAVAESVAEEGEESIRHRFAPW